MMDIKEVQLQWFISYFDKKTAGGAVKNENISNKESAEELQKPITRKFEKRKVHLSFIDNVWSADLADIQLINRFYKGLRFLLCVIDIFSKNAWVTHLKDKKSITITNASGKILDESYPKSNKIWVDKRSKFYKRSMES